MGGPCGGVGCVYPSKFWIRNDREKLRTPFSKRWGSQERAGGKAKKGGGT